MPKVKVKGMHCKSCEMLIADGLVEAGAEKVEVSESKGFASAEGISEEEMKKVIKAEGYGVE